MIIAVDLDGCIITYKGDWKGPDMFGTVIPGAREALEQMHEAGHRIIIHTCRYPTPALGEFLRNNHIPFDDINIDRPNSYEDEYAKVGKNIGFRKVHADLYIDDRGFRFEGDWNAVLEFISSNKHIPWENKAL